MGRASHRAPRLIELEWGDPAHPRIAGRQRRVLPIPAAWTKIRRWHAANEEGHGRLQRMWWRAQLIAGIEIARAASRSDRRGGGTRLQATRTGLAISCLHAKACRSKSATPTPRAAWPRCAHLRQSPSPNSSSTSPPDRRSARGARPGIAGHFCNDEGVVCKARNHLEANPAATRSGACHSGNRTTR